MPASSEALDAELRSNELFGFPVLSRTIVVQRNPEGLSSAAQAGTLGRAVAINRGTLPGAERAGGAIPVLNTVSIPPFTRERGTTAITYLYFGLDVGQGEQLDVAARVADRAQRATRPASRASRERWPRARRSRG